MSIDRRKSNTYNPCTGCLVSIFTVGINSKSLPWPVHSVQAIYPQPFLHWTRHHFMLQCDDDGLRGRGLMTSLGEGKDRSLNKIMANWVILLNTYLSILSSCYCADRSIVGHWYVYNAAMSLTTVSATMPVIFSDDTRRYSVPVRRAGTFFMLQVQV